MGKDLKGNNLGKGYGQRKDGRYEARAKINGHKIHLYNMDLKQLKKDFEIAKAQALIEERNIYPNGYTVLQWYQQWFDTIKAPTLKNDVSRSKYNSKLMNTYISILGDKEISTLTQNNIQIATNILLEKKYTTKTIRDALSGLRKCLDSAIVNKLLISNPCTDILFKNDNIYQKERRVLSQEEQEIFLKEIENNYYKEVYMFLLSTGLRIGELSGLQWNDIDFINNTITIQRSLTTGYVKGKKIEELSSPKTQSSYRVIPFFKDTKSLLTNWKNKQDKLKDSLGNRWRANEALGDLVFTTTVGSPCTRYVLQHDLTKIENNINNKEITKAFYENRQPIKFDHISPHAFRHTFATRCFEKGMDPLVVQKLMGHTNYSMTVSYTHVLNNKINEEINKIGTLL